MHELITLFNYLNGQNERKTETFDPPCEGMRILESGKILLMESGILGFGIRNTAQGFRIPLNPESKFNS